MGWGMPPIMMKIGPTVMKWWYDNAYETDCFIGYCSELDYFNPSKFPELDLHMSHLDIFAQPGSKLNDPHFLLISPGSGSLHTTVV